MASGDGGVGWWSASTWSWSLLRGTCCWRCAILFGVFVAGDGNESTREKEERKAYEKMVGQSVPGMI